MRLRSIGVLSLLAAANAALGAGYDAFGFEQPLFAPGPLAGQDGWTGGASGGGIEPIIVDAPDPVLGEQAVRLEVGPTSGDWSWMDHAFVPADLIAAGYTQLTVSYDIHRLQDSDMPLQWWLWDDGDPTWGHQQWIFTAPHAFSNGPTVFGRYANVTMTWDFVTMLAHSWYDGAIVDNGIAITNINSLTGWTIHLSNQGGSSTAGDVVWIDNFQAMAIPEPASLVLLTIAGALLRRR